jgi:TATA-binding protein-associated factor
MNVLPLLGERTDAYARQGAIECVYAVVDALKIDVVPYIVFLMVPVLGRMTDQVM